MKHGDIGVYIAIFGLVNQLSAHQFTSKGLIGGPIGKAGLYLTIPVFVSLIWRIALGIHWWTILLFLALSLSVGYINGKIIVSRHANGLSHADVFLGLQPLQTIIFITSAIVCWLF